jgi:hypothetical protein
MSSISANAAACRVDENAGRIGFFILKLFSNRNQDIPIHQL